MRSASLAALAALAAATYQLPAAGPGMPPPPRRPRTPTEADHARLAAADARRAARNAKRARAAQRGLTALEFVIAATIVGLVVFIVQSSVQPRPAQPRDSTDPASGPRSGMAVRVDELTGCQYLAVYRGGITPRLDASGRPICDRSAPR